MSGVSQLGSLILRDLAPRPGARLLSQICPTQLPGKIRRGLPSLIREHREGEKGEKIFSTSMFFSGRQEDKATPVMAFVR